MMEVMGLFTPSGHLNSVTVKPASTLVFCENHSHETKEVVYKDVTL